MPSASRDAGTLLACPRCEGRLAASGASLRCPRCGGSFPVEDGIPDLRLPLDRRADVVRDFYSVAPFPGYPPRDSWSALRRRAERSAFARLLDEAIAPDATVLEMGCGTGQTSLFLATAERRVVGADLTRASLRLAAEAARRFGIDRVRFVETDLRAPGLRPGAFDVVYCSGVLHHTPDPEASFRALARLARPGGVVVVGVYNAYARLPHRLRRALARLTGLRWIPLDPVLRDRAAEPERRLAWIRDQYRHPEEHRHTLAEVQRWFRASGVAYLRAYPSTIIGEPPLGRGGLFSPAADDWGPENVLQQLGWSWTLGREGGLFVVVGRTHASAFAGEKANPACAASARSSPSPLP
jgi:SAM-dependent methyltransferase